MRTKCYSGIRTLKVLVLMAALCSFTMALGQEKNMKEALYDRQAGALIPGARYVLKSPVEAYPSSVRLSENSGISESDFIGWYRQTLQMPAEIDLNREKKETDEYGYVHVRYSQLYRSIEVDRAGIVVQYKDGQATSINGQLYQVGNVEVVPRLSEEAALQSATAHVGAKRYMWDDPAWEREIKTRKADPSATYRPAGKLTVTKFSARDQEGIHQDFRLAYSFDIYALSPSIEERVLVDAMTGEILYTLPLSSNCEPPVNFTSVFNGIRSVSTDFTDPEYRLRDDCAAAVVHVWDWNSATSTHNRIEIENTTNTWTTMDERFGASVLWETKQSYAYFLNVHGRNSYNNAGGDVNAHINAVFYSSSCDCDYTDNASMSFTGGTMKVGLGSSGTLDNSWSSVDIIGHEFTHAVTGSSSELVYQGESGALNESFSDIFGEMIEHYVDGPNDWLMGDDRTNGAIRSMADPKDFGDPDTYLGTNWKNTCGGCGDNGGVHSNSGVMNYWFFLVAMGGDGTNDNGDDYDVAGIGRTKASAIAFRNMTLKLSENSDYADARAGAIEAAEDLYGSCSEEVKQVTNAWYAVGVGNPYCEAVLTSAEKPGGFNISCSGGSDGTIELELLGTGPFTVLWDDGPSSETRSGLPAGTYGVTVTDATGCSDYASITLTEPPVLSVTAVVTSDYNGYAVSCAGGADGMATAAGSGGAPPYTYLWDANAGNQATAVASGLAAGTYWVTVTDANGCTSPTSVTLDEPLPLTIDAGPNQTVYYGYPPMACATLTYSGEGGGVPPYSLSWSTGEITQDIQVCPAVSTEYVITITDANNCSETDTVIVCAIDVRCGKNLDKVEICHIPPGNPGNARTLCVAIPSVADHLAHGDMIAACGTDHSCTSLEPKSAPAGEISLEATGISLEAHPNPFSNATTVTFSTDSGGKANLRLVDFTGRNALILFDGQVEEHTAYTVQIDGSSLVSGMYHLILVQGDGTMKTLRLLNNN